MSRRGPRRGTRFTCITVRSAGVTRVAGGICVSPEYPCAAIAQPCRKWRARGSVNALGQDRKAPLREIMVAGAELSGRDVAGKFGGALGYLSQTATRGWRNAMSEYSDELGAWWTEFPGSDRASWLS